LTWTKAIAGDLDSLGYVSEINEQRRFYSRYVSPNVSKGNRVFVVISDALRYEVAAELSESLSHNTKGKATLEAVQAVFPSITKVWDGGSAARQRSVGKRQNRRVC
jgi:spore cortex formation protein SpoVR/YcgB (stage V sporulation)